MKKTIFICQFTENHLRVIKFSAHKSQEKFLGREVEEIPPGIDERLLGQKLKRIFDKLIYRQNPIILSLPRSLATCRYLKIPSILPEEIEKIAQLQAMHYLPYPPAELITGYQIIESNKAGFSYINLIIVHQDIVERYLKIIKELKPKRIEVILSSYGLTNLYNYLNPKSEVAMLIDVDDNQVELAIISEKKLIFSRSFKLDLNEPNWKEVFIDQIKKTQQAYTGDLSYQPLTKIVLFEQKRAAELREVLNNALPLLPVEIKTYNDKIKIDPSGLFNLIGLASGKRDSRLNLLPQEMKERLKEISRKKAWLKIIALISGIILIFGLGLAQGLRNKALYLAKLKSELNSIAKDTKFLEDIERRLNILAGRKAKGTAGLLNLFSELHQIIPSEISLTNFQYEENNRVSLRGQAQELNPVFALVSLLEKSAAYKNFKIKVRYATWKRTQLGEFVDFEIICIRER